MKTNRTKSRQALETGQLWKTKDAYIKIVELGVRLIHYKMMKQPEQKAVRTRMSSVATLDAYLKVNAAKLVN